ncbi:MAG TPA: hypothetical protein VLH08_19870, partial [Acidobacteriota bacterium]|nr:hypothetical protein [Acidobacteriota bacterium]
MRTQSTLIKIIIILLPFVVGCFDVKQDITLNPDGSGKSVVEAYVQTSIPGSDMETTNDDGSSTARDFLSKSTGIEAWKDVQYKRAADGRIYFKGTAYFKDYSQVNIENAGFDLALVKEGNTLTLQSREEKSEKSKEAKPDNAKIEEAKKQWAAMKPMMSAMLETLKQQDTIKLPGKLIEVSNFTKVSDNTV